MLFKNEIRKMRTEILSVTEGFSFQHHTGIKYLKIMNIKVIRMSDVNTLIPSLQFSRQSYVSIYRSPKLKAASSLKVKSQVKSHCSDNVSVTRDC